MRIMFLSLNLRDLLNENMFDGLVKIIGIFFIIRKIKWFGINLLRIIKVLREMRFFECCGMMLVVFLREKLYKMLFDILLIDIRILCFGGKYFGVCFE